MIIYNYRIKANLRTRVWSSLKYNYKAARTLELIGCSIEELKQWLESQFTEGMTWDNYGEWHVDHVYPCSKFNLEQPYEQRIAFNWFNLQPMWAHDNLTKSNKLL